MIILVFDTEEKKLQFATLYETYKRTVLYTVRLFVDDEYAAEDLLHDIFLIIARHLDKIDPNNPVQTRNYIITIARNYSKSYLRKLRRLKEESLDSSEIVSLPNKNSDILNQMIMKDLCRRLAGLIDNLDDKNRTVMELKYIYNFTNDEIADFLNITKRTVKMRLYRSKLKLRSQLEKEHYV